MPSNRKPAGGKKKSVQGPRREIRGAGRAAGFLAAARRLLYWCFVLAIWGGIAAAGIVVYYGARMPSVADWAVPDRPPNVKIVSVDGKLVANRGMTGGEAVGLHEMSPYIPMAVIAIEDRRFYSHVGVDPIGLARAVFNNLTQRPLLAGRLDADPAARQEPVPQARAHAGAQGAGGAAGAVAGAQAQQGPDPRNVPEPGLFRLGLLRRRGGVAPLFRQIGARRDAGRGGRAGRPAQGAVASCRRRAIPRPPRTRAQLVLAAMRERRHDRREGAGDRDERAGRRAPPPTGPARKTTSPTASWKSCPA